MTITIEALSATQIGELFCLQRCCFVDEAILYETPEVPALLESFGDFSVRHEGSTTRVALEGTRIVGAVSVRSYREPYPDVERLMVAPDVRRRGLASTLLDAAEELVRVDGGDGVQLIVGELATKNRALYSGAGYEVTGRHVVLETVALLTMAKRFGPTS